MAKEAASGGGGVRQTVPSERKRPARDAIFSAAVRLFARNGFGATGVRQIAREAGVNLAAINYAFGSKLGLLEAILDDFFSGFVLVLDAGLDTGGPIEARLRHTVRAVAEYFGAERDKLLIALTELPHDTPEITEFKARHVRRLASLIEAAFTGALGPERARQIPIAIVGPAMSALAASHFLFRPVLERVQPPGFDDDVLERYPEIIADLFTDGIKGLIPDPGNDVG